MSNTKRSWWTIGKCESRGSEILIYGTEKSSKSLQQKERNNQNERCLNNKIWLPTYNIQWKHCKSKWKYQKVEWVRDRKYYLQIKISDVERKLKKPDVPKTD